MPTKVIGLSGLATCGKDAFCSLLVDELQQRGKKAKRFALADELKRRIREPLLDLSGIDVVVANKQDKELVRPYMVAVGHIKRYQSEGKYWTGLLQKEIESEPELDYAVVSDIRYDHFPEDESWWIQKGMGGLLVHISRYVLLSQDEGINRREGEWSEEEQGYRLYIKPPNEHEAINDPKVLKRSDYQVDWSTSPSKEPIEILRHCRPYVQDFVKYLGL